MCAALKTKYTLRSRVDTSMTDLMVEDATMDAQCFSGNGMVCRTCLMCRNIFGYDDHPDVSLLTKRFYSVPCLPRK